VCRRFNELAYTPALLRDIRLTVTKPYGEIAPEVRAQRLRSACEWLVRRAAGHVQQLQLKVYFEDLPEPEPQECSTHVVAAIAACGAAGSLRQLSLEVVELPPGATWLLAARNLLSLSLRPGSACDVDSPLHTLTALEQLWLPCGQELCLQPGARLPPSLTRLYLDECSDSLPQQVRWHTAALGRYFEQPGAANLWLLLTCCGGSPPDARSVAALWQ